MSRFPLSHLGGSLHPSFPLSVSPLFPFVPLRLFLVVFRDAIVLNVVPDFSLCLKDITVLTSPAARHSVSVCIGWAVTVEKDDHDRGNDHGRDKEQDQRSPVLRVSPTEMLEHGVALIWPNDL